MTGPTIRERALAALDPEDRALGSPSTGAVIAAFALIAHEAEDRAAGIPPVLATDGEPGRRILRRLLAFPDPPPDPKTFDRAARAALPSVEDAPDA